MILIQNVLFTSNTSQRNLYEQSFLFVFSLYCPYFTFICSILGPNLNDAGRGMNLIVLDAKTFHVSRIAHFDTWQNSTQNNLLNRRTYNIHSVRVLLTLANGDNIYNILVLFHTNVLFFIFHRFRVNGIIS